VTTLLISSVYPCPPGQEEFLNQGERDSQMWCMMASRKLPEFINADEWLEGTKKLTEINGILRSSWLRISDSEWAGVVLKDTTLRITRKNVKDDQEAQEFIEEFWSDRFTFGIPWVKYAVLTYPDNTTELVVKMNHSVYDGTLFRIFDDHFKAIQTGSEVPHHGEFRDFASHIYQSDRDTSLDYWKDEMEGKNYSFLDAQISDLKVAASVKKIFDNELEPIAQAAAVQAPIIFQVAYQLWLSRTFKTNDISFDYLLSGRVVELPDPQTINGTMANFLPVRSKIQTDATLKDYMQETQDQFWAICEHGNVGMDAIYAAAGLDRSIVGNKTLFLYQPFEPAAAGEEAEKLRWIVMAKSKVRMFQPYALVVEVAKAPGNKHRLTVMYDENVYNEEKANVIAEEILGIINTLTDEDADVERDIKEIL
jgi:hypothetical protein